MTIQDALERAKQLHKSRERVPTARPEPTQSLPDDTASIATLREPESPRPEPALRHSPLQRVEFDAASCEENRVLLTESQLATAGRAAAAYRLMRGRVLHRINAGKWSCVGITSSGPGEGKTVTSINLAISIAREKQRMVVLLDLDMRHPSVFERVGLQPPRELSQFFLEELEPQDVLFETGVENLVVAGNRAVVPTASEMLASKRFDELLRCVRRWWPGALVLMDLPPVLSTDEALVVAPRVDAMFLVVCEGVTRRDSLARAAKLLGDFNVAGIIMNQSSDDVGGNYYGY
jgi:capsular exopolysaccharide synthesis family protein